MNLNKHQREELKFKYSGYCAYCGTRLTDKWHADHVEPLQRTGKWVPAGYRKMQYVQTGSGRTERDTVDNLAPACVPCNNDKSDLSLEQWRKRLQKAAETLERNYSTYKHAKRFKLVIEAPPIVIFYFERHGTTPRRAVNE